MVEVFKTDITKPKVAKKVLAELSQKFPEYKINFDLDDCDKILRVENTSGLVDPQEVINLISEVSFFIEVLPDVVSKKVI